MIDALTCSMQIAMLIQLKNRALIEENEYQLVLNSLRHDYVRIIALS